jgi:hypothetical protein
MSDKPQYQINFKLNNGNLINLYADSADQLAEQLSYIQGLSGTISSVFTSLNGSSPAIGNHPAGSAVNNVAAAFGGEVISITQNKPESFALHDNTQCKHGARTYRESKPGATRAWRAYMCPTPKGTPDQCEPNFIK